MNLTDSKIIEQTSNWIKSVVIDCNFCPFAAKALLKKSIHYSINYSMNLKDSICALSSEVDYLNTHNNTETSFIIFPNTFTDFKEYLMLVKKAEQFLSKNNYDGIYQIASFHPDYCFADTETDDPANYTNRSIYPMLHLLREESITKALSLFKEPEAIPERNVNFARKKGLLYMQMLRTSCI